MSTKAERIQPLRIANSKGVPGTLGCLAHDLFSQRRVVLSSWHVLFGNGAQAEEPVWLVEEGRGGGRFSWLGKTLRGKIGELRFEGESCHLDCALSSFLCPEQSGSPGVKGRELSGWPVINGEDRARTGELVTKCGAATGSTTGVVIATDYVDRAWIGGRPRPAVGQILVRSANAAGAFCASGDSGSILINAKGKAVGLIWGANSRGDGVACPIFPVLSALDITLEAGTNKADEMSGEAGALREAVFS